jgi:hypothetical protein
MGSRLHAWWIGRAGTVRIKAYLQATEYTDAAALAAQNEQYTKESTTIKEAQQARSLTLAQGGIQANQAGGGFAMSGSSLDILRDSAGQGAIAHAVIGQQGLITEAGYPTRG